MKLLLDPPDAFTNYCAAKERRDPGSGKWLMEDSRYKAWKQNPQSLLWLHGIRTLRQNNLVSL